MPVIFEPEPSGDASGPRAANGAQPPYAPSENAIAAAVRAELSELGAKPEGGFIDVDVEGGVVMLQGTVPTLLHVRVALERTGTVRGVRGIVNRLKVVRVSVNDADLEQRVRSRLAEDPALQSISLSVSAKLGSVRLSGRAHSNAEVELAEQVAASVRGVRELINELELVATSRPDGEIQRDVVARLASDAFLSDDRIDVMVEGGRVVLSGFVGTFMERARAQSLAWVSGARVVDVQHVAVAPAQRDPQQRLTRPVPADTAMKRALSAALRLDPRVPDGAISFDVRAGIVRLRGTVPSLSSKRAAEADAAHTTGVWRVESSIEVMPVVATTDAKLSRTIRLRLAEHPEIDPQDLSVEVSEGSVTISGAADNTFESALISRIVESIPGVVEVQNRVLPVPPSTARPDDAVLKRRIETALWWDPRVEASRVEVDVRGGIATIRGHAPNLAVHDAIIENVRQAGARSIRDELERSHR